MNSQKIKEAKFEAKRFLKKVAEMEKRHDTINRYEPSKEKSAVKRSSLDLSRALSELRKPF